SAALPSASLRAKIAALTRSFRPLIAGPCVLRSSGVIEPSVLSSADTEPLLPSAATRTPSSAASSFAFETAPSSSVSSCAMSDIGVSPLCVMRGLDPRIPLRLARCPPDRDGRDKPGHDKESLSLCRQRGLGLFDDRLEGRRLVDREIGQHLAVYHQPRLGEPGDEAAVVQSERAHGRVQALNPERAESALAALAVAEGVLPGLFDGLLGDADRVLAAAVIALGGLVDFLVLGVSGDTTFYAGHD